MLFAFLCASAMNQRRPEEIRKIELTRIEERVKIKVEAPVAEERWRSPTPERSNKNAHKKKRVAKRSHPIAKSERKRRSKRKKKKKRKSGDCEADSKVKLGKAAKQKEDPMVAMDKLFQKTLSMPGLYWIPLSKEERRERRKRKLQKEKEEKEEIKKRKKELKKMEKERMRLMRELECEETLFLMA